jgi:hypothetical protein
MSATTYWKPWSPPPKEDIHPLDQLPWKLAPRLWGHDSTLRTDETEVGSEIVPYLEGLMDGGGNDLVCREARELIDAIEKYGKIVLWIER